MIGYSGIYSPNNKKNQESIAIRLVYSQNSENRESRNYKCMAFSGFSLPNCDLCPSPMIKYSFFKNGHSFIHFMLPDRIRFYKTDNFPLSHRQYQLLMHIIFLCKIPIARFRWQLQYSRLLQLVH